MVVIILILFSFQIIGNTISNDFLEFLEFVKNGDYELATIALQMDPDYRNMMDDGGMTAMDWAIKNNHLNIAAVLINPFWNYNSKTKDYILLYNAIFKGDIETVKKLIEKDIDLSLKNYLNETLLQVAYKLNENDVFNLLLIKFSQNKNFKADIISIFLIATKNGHFNIVKKCIEENVDINHYDENNSKAAIHYAAENGYYSIVELLIKNKCDLNLCDFNYMTPIFYAIQNNHIGIVDILIKAGTNVNKIDRYGRSVLDFACEKSRTAIIEMLKVNGAKFNIEALKHLRK